MAETKPAPYMSYATFTKAIETLADTTVPTGPLDRRVLQGISGSEYGALISGMQFLGLVDNERRATAIYRELVGLWSDRPKFKERFLKILLEKYAPVISKLDLQHGTAAELEKAFKDYGVSQGQMLSKSIRFFLKSVGEAGINVSPHMTAPKPRTLRAPNAAGKNGTSKMQPAKQDTITPADAMRFEPPQGVERLPLPGMANSFIQYPVNLTEADCQVLEAMVRVLRTSVEARTGGKDRKQ